MLSLEEARSWYPADDPVHGFEHIRRVLQLAEYLAAAEGADQEIVRAAVLLHDVELPANPNQQPANNHLLQSDGKRSLHHLDSAEFAHRRLDAEGWTPEQIAAVEHCIRSHRFRDDREQPQSLEAQVMFDADKLDAIGAVGVARAVAYAIRHGQPFYAPPSPGFLQSGTREPGEAHSAFHEYIFKLRRIKDRLYTKTALTLAEERHALMVVYFEQLAKEAA